MLCEPTKVLLPPPALL
ncbi:hypothetical protein Zm00014a_041818 [Zea mays]|uniref:Uncharacterized protein n=1 Tax=Zea mays TaxID=4577 RepID=A0A3L6DBG3_MAIZE|nr:hypothetical protein Zm00014a_041818 [Zea mays]